MNPISILMFCFSGALLLYAGLLALTKDYTMIPRNYAVKPKDPKAYAVAFAKMMALVALAPLGSGIYAQFNPALGLAALGVGLVICIWAGTRFFRNL